MGSIKEFRPDLADVARVFVTRMTLQGYLAGRLLVGHYRDDNNFIYWFWYYCTGTTVPVLFTVSGFIFAFPLIKESDITKVGRQNPCVKKGIRRGSMFIGIAYFLRMGFQSVDALHYIGLSFLLLITTYLLSYNRKV